MFVIIGLILASTFICYCAVYFAGSSIGSAVIDAVKGIAMGIIGRKK